MLTSLAYTDQGISYWPSYRYRYRYRDRAAMGGGPRGRAVREGRELEGTSAEGVSLPPATRGQAR